ncbi:MAG: hypothetical protein U5K00_17855 [Melioribacteraceae bacterium]|nr:hypothetical protein [Melioribacteraceae bacterium]
MQGSRKNPEAKAPLIISRSTETSKDSLFIKVEVMDVEPIPSRLQSQTADHHLVYSTTVFTMTVQQQATISSAVTLSVKIIGQAALMMKPVMSTTDNINLPFDNKGVLADVNYQSTLFNNCREYFPVILHAERNI